MEIPKRPVILIDMPELPEKKHPSLKDLEPDPDDIFADDDDYGKPELPFRPTPPAEYKTFEELGFTEEPYVIEFREKYGKYPILEPNGPHRLPTRYTDEGGEKKYHMKTTYRPGQKFQIIGTEPGKRKKGSLNIVFMHPEDGDQQIVLTPKDMITKMRINTTATEISEKPAEVFDMKPEEIGVSSDVKEILQKRKKEAFVSI